MAVSVLPNLLGFGVSGYAIWIGWGDPEFRRRLAQLEMGPGVSAYAQVSATFAHFALMQVLRKVCKTPGRSDWREGSAAATMEIMKQLGLGPNLSTKRTRKRELLEEMERVVPWSALVQVVEPYKTMLDEIVGNAPHGAVEMLTHFKDVNAPALHSFVHGGIHAIQRGLKRYPVEVLANVVRSSNGLYTMAGMLLAILSGAQALAKRVSKIQPRFADCLPTLITPAVKAET